ncbi:MAG: hypothetical protein R3F43_33100, partial [bacterium]
MRTVWMLLAGLAVAGCDDGASGGGALPDAALAEDGGHRDAHADAAPTPDRGRRPDVGRPDASPPRDARVPPPDQ